MSQTSLFQILRSQVSLDFGIRLVDGSQTLEDLSRRIGLFSTPRWRQQQGDRTKEFLWLTHGFRQEILREGYVDLSYKNVTEKTLYYPNNLTLFNLK